jgi:hypothetical protein
VKDTASFYAPTVKVRRSCNLIVSIKWGSGCRLVPKSFHEKAG